MIRSLALAAALTCVAGAGAAQVADLRAHDALRVCADPAAAPMSMEDGSGFENRIAELIGEKLGLPVSYTWFPQGAGFIRKTLRAGACDVVIGYAQGDEMVQNTNHYYTSAYGVVTRKDGPLAGVDTLSDPALKDQPIGVVAGTPPATNLARAGLAKNMRGWDLFVDRRVENPVGDRLPDPDASDAADHVVQALQMLDVDCGEDIDTGVEQFFDILPALGMPATGGVAVRQFVHQDQRWPPRQRAIEIELPEGPIPVRNFPERQNFQALQQRGGFLATVGFNDAHHHIQTLLAPLAGGQ